MLGWGRRGWREQGGTDCLPRRLRNLVHRCLQGSESQEPPTYQETQKQIPSLQCHGHTTLLDQISTTKSGPRDCSINSALTPWVPAAVRLAPSKTDLRSDSLVSPPCPCTEPTPLIPYLPLRPITFPAPLPPTLSALVSESLWA